MSQPLVSIGIPAYNREKLIVRAIESALGQDYRNIELIISDNASTDGTEAVCRAFAARDPRVTYIQQETNRGAVANFEAVFERGRGEYFLWLGDDDWFDLDYVSSCVAVLEAHPDHVAAYGRAIYYRGDELIWNRAGFSLPQDDAARRVIAYYAQVDDNALFYGVFRRAALQKAGAMRNVVAGDWMFLAAVAFQGKVRMLGETRVHRVLGGASESYRKILVSLGLNPRHAPIFMLLAGREAWRDIMRASAYAPLRRRARWWLALRCLPWFFKRHLWGIWTTWKVGAGVLQESPFTRPLYKCLRWFYRLARNVRRLGRRG